ncbi:MAG: hypothetical protein R2748_30640 [Bryobacterales bacterium]
MQVTEPTYFTRFVYSSGGSLLTQAFDSNGDQISPTPTTGLGRIATQDDGRPETPPTRFTYQETSQGTVTTYTDRLGFDYVYGARRELSPAALCRPARRRDALRVQLERRSHGHRGRPWQTHLFQYDSAGNVTRLPTPPATQRT